MLTADKNRQLTQVGPGTPMGEVLRRHWHPVAGIDELARDPPAAAIFLRDGGPLPPGARLVQPQLAATLQRIVDGGSPRRARCDGCLHVVAWDCPQQGLPPRVRSIL